MTYTVTENDTIQTVANKFGVPANELISVNNLRPGSVLFPGMIIVIPPRSPSRPPVTPVPPIWLPQNRTYVVRRGDTIWSVARRFGVRVDDLMYVNGLRFPIIYPGQRLIIPFSNIMPL